MFLSNERDEHYKYRSIIIIKRCVSIEKMKVNFEENRKIWHVKCAFYEFKFLSKEQSASEYNLMLLLVVLTNRFIPKKHYTVS